LEENPEASVAELAKASTCDETYVRRILKKLKNEEATEEKIAA